eukprot:16435859-Heterocapsa_arctica.AAC.1
MALPRPMPGQTLHGGSFRPSTMSKSRAAVQRRAEEVVVGGAHHDDRPVEHEDARPPEDTASDHLNAHSRDEVRDDVVLNRGKG